MSVIIVSSVYLSLLCQYAFVSHPIVYCFLLLGCSICVASVSYLILGFSWYMALFCLVYVGGVYILFIFISVHIPNPTPYIGLDYLNFPVFFVMFVCLLAGGDFTLGSTVECSHYLCSEFEGYTYCLFCVTLLVGFGIISIVSSDKGSFYR